LKEKDKLDSLRLADFGLSAKYKNKSGFAVRQKCGTLSYMAPELIKEGTPM
jgi:serine/threonine protein kinase